MNATDHLAQAITDPGAGQACGSTGRTALAGRRGIRANRDPGQMGISGTVRQMRQCRSVAMAGA
jgi:hypothetical protein